jgi:itaconyl-CoA hydratase
MSRQHPGDQMFSFYRRIGAQRYQECHGLDFEDFAPGQRFRHRPGVTLSQQDNVDEALDTLNGAMLHFDAHYAAATAWQKPLMVSTLTLQRVVGMASKTYARRTAILGFPEIVLNGPVFGGDTLYAASEVLECDEAAGAITVRLIGHKADGAEVARITCRMAIARRDDGAAAEDARFAAYHPADDGALVEQCGLFFEGHVAGESFVHTPRRSFFAEEVVAHAWRSLELTPAHHDLDWIERHRNGRIAVPEPLLIGAATALTTRHFGRVSANLGWLDVEFPTPVFAGDTIEAESTVLATRESRSRPGEGIVTVATETRNQHGQPVLRFRRNLLVYRRHAAGMYARAGY